MKPLFLGLNANGRRVILDPEQRKTTHLHVLGGSGTGKSKFLEWMARRDILGGQALCLIDWHGELYNELLEWCSYHGMGIGGDARRLILVDPSRPEHVQGFNPFNNQAGDISTAVSRRVDSTIKPWGASDTDTMPTFERVCRTLYHFAAETGETLPNAALMLEHPNRAVRRFAIENVSDTFIRTQLMELQAIERPHEWREQVLSTKNRIGRFIGPKGIRRFIGLTQNNLDLLNAMDEGHIVLLNLGESEFLTRDAARVFAALFLNEFFRAAMLRANRREGRTPKPYVLYLDEFQNYMSDELAAMLDEVRKGGLHMVLAHQHLGHLQKYPSLRKSVFTNARIRAVFGGLDYEDAEIIANEMFLPDLNARQIKKAYYHTIHLYSEETRVTSTRTDGYSSGFGESESQTTASSRSRQQGKGFSTITPPARDQEGWSVRRVTPGTSESDNEGEGESSQEAFTKGSSSFEAEMHSVSDSEVPVFVPIPVKELGSESEWGREEKVSKAVETLKQQSQRHCFVKLDTRTTVPMKVPLVKPARMPLKLIKEYETAVYAKQRALSGEEADRLIALNEERFLLETGQKTPRVPLLVEDEEVYAGEAGDPRKVRHRK